MAAFGPKAQCECTSGRSTGTKEIPLRDSVVTKMTWDTCDSVGLDLVFDWPIKKRPVPSTSQETLVSAGRFVREWEAAAKEKVSPFGDLPGALEKISRSTNTYILGDDIPVTNNGIPGWDGAWVALSSTTHQAQLTVHYWANP